MIGQRRPQADPRRALAAGDAAWAILTTDPKPSGRSTVLGAAFVRVIFVAEPVRVRVERASPEWMAGREIEIPRLKLYADRSREERRAFGDVLSLLWPAAAGLTRRGCQ